MEVDLGPSKRWYASPVWTRHPDARLRAGAPESQRNDTADSTLRITTQRAPSHTSRR